MKKIIVSILIGIGVFNFSNAQIKPSFGLKAGLNFSSISEVEFTGEDGSTIEELGGNSTGFHVGVVLHIPIKKYGVMLEALYSSEGGDNIDLDYINVPILLTYKIIPGLKAHLGPQFKFNVNSDIDIDFDGIEADFIDADSFEDDVKDFNFDGAIGLEYKLPVIGVFAQARYVFGLSDIADNFEEKQNSFQLSVGYRF